MSENQRTTRGFAGYIRKSTVTQVLIGATVALLMAAGAITYVTWSAPSYKDAGMQRIAPFAYKDGVTGCEYLKAYGRDFTPRFAADGTHKGCVEAEP